MSIATARLHAEVAAARESRRQEDVYGLRWQLRRSDDLLDEVEALNAEGRRRIPGPLLLRLNAWAREIGRWDDPLPLTVLEGLAWLYRGQETLLVPLRALQEPAEPVVLTRRSARKACRWIGRQPKGQVRATAVPPWLAPRLDALVEAGLVREFEEGWALCRGWEATLDSTRTNDAG